MEDKALENFVTILKEKHRNKASSLYSNIKYPLNHTTCPQDVIKTVSSQIKAMQMADRVVSKDLKKKNIIPQEKPPGDEVLKKNQQFKKFDTQCVSDTQLIDVVKVAEAYDADRGVTQDLDVSFTVSDLEKINKRNTPEEKPESYNNTTTTGVEMSSGRCKDIKTDPVGKETVINNDNLTANVATCETTFRGFTEDFADDHIICKDKVDNEQEYEAVRTKDNYNNNDSLTNNIVGIQSLVGFTKDFVESDKDIFEENEYECSDDDFDALERDRCVSLSPILDKIEPIKTISEHCGRERDKDRPVSPIFMVQNVRKNKSPSPLIFNLDSFERFEEVAIPLVEENPDFETAKHLINSQILDKELFLPAKATKEITSIDNIKYLDTGPNVDNNVEGTGKPQFRHDKEKTSSSLEDEILFSSDEEYYEHKEIQDLPFTCALETSFYDQPDILDKTMYVGFQTASNKSIQVYTESFTKAKGILNEISSCCKKELTLTELVKICDNVSKNESKHVNAKPECTENLDNKDDSIEIPDLSILVNKLSKDPMKELVSMKSVLITDVKDEVIEENTQFPDIDMSMLHAVVNNAQENNDKHTNGRPMADYDDTKQDINKNITKFGHNILPSNLNKFEGFTTASNKTIKLSDAALARCQKVFHDIDLHETFNKNDVENKSIGNNIGFEKHITDVTTKIDSNKTCRDDMLIDMNDEIILQEFENIEMSLRPEVKEAMPLVGFKTASNKKIQISDKASENAKRLFEDIPIESLDIATNFTTETKNEDIKYESNIPTHPLSNVGFKTASNKNINISDKALAKTKNVFHDIELEIVNNSTDTQVKEVKPGRSFEDFVEPSTSKGFTGFQTASNKTIEISNKALLRSKDIFKDIDNAINETIGHKIEKKGHKITNSKDVIMLKEAIMQSKHIFDESTTTKMISTSKSKSNAVQFTTASNKPVHISVKALERSKKIFQSEILGSDDQPNLDTPGTSELATNKIALQTASNKPVHISAEALERSKKVFQDEIPQSPNKICVSKVLKSTPNITIQTANHKPVHIPKRALERTKKIFQNLDSQNIGCKFDDNREIKISEHVRAKSNQLHDFNDSNDPIKLADDSSSNRIIERPFKGFQTASKKDVKISREALDRCKRIFQDINFSKDFDGEKPSSDIARDFEIESSKKGMCGFKTANNMPMSVSVESIARSKRLFDDIDDIHTNIPKTGNGTKRNSSTNEIYPVISNYFDYKPLTEDIKYPNDNINKIGNFGGFKTASNKNVDISDQALAKSRQIFQDMDSLEATDITGLLKDKIRPKANIDDGNGVKKFKTDISHDIKVSKDVPPVKLNKENIADIINTQVLDNFEDTLYTEDFREEIPSRNKRSGSPILSCPKAKKRRFETPYKTIKIETNTIFIKDPEKQKVNSIFTENYKKNKMYKLKELSPNDKCPIDPYLTKFDFDTLLNFEFDGERNDVTENKLDINILKDIFLNSVNKKLVPNGWLENHIKLILWKLISYEVKFLKSLGTVCSAPNLLDQLKYRYDKELYNAERPALRKILEKDDVPSKTMVLCVVAIYADGVKIDGVASADNIELLLTDGWYCIMTTIDKMLTRLVKEEKIVVGSKIVTNGAELLNCEQGVAPWENKSSIRLKIFGNSTRRACWDARLGYHGNGAILSHLSNVKLDGGKVSKLRLYIARVFPALYVEKFDDGSTVTRSERLEHLHQAKYETDRQNLLEKLYEEVEKEFSDLDSQDCDITWDGNKNGLQSGSQIFDAIRKSKDPSDMKNNLTSTQTKLLEAHTAKRRDQLLEKVQARLTEKIDNNGLMRSRNVVTVLKARVLGVDRNAVVTKGLLSIWKPNYSILDLIKEDSWIEVMNVVPTAIRYSEIQISAGRHSMFIQSKHKENERVKLVTNTFKRKCYSIKELNNKNPTEFNEVDTVGLIFLIEPSMQDFDSKSHFQNVYLADKACNMVCVNFWGGLQKFGFQNVLDTGQVVACINLQKRAGNTRNIPQYRATEFTYFTKTPKNPQAKEMIDEFNIPVLDRRKICEECCKLKSKFSTKSNENVTPYRINDLGKNKVYLDSVENICHADFNLTGLDFESSFRQELSPNTLKRKREVNNRINKLKMYGEPPPLSHIHIINKTKNAMSSYKSPMSNDVDVANVKRVSFGMNEENKVPIISRQDSVACETIRNVANHSPVTSQNKFLKNSANPVKLNFDNSNSVDQFSGEFEASPPLSLD